MCSACTDAPARCGSARAGYLGMRGMAFAIGYRVRVVALYRGWEESLASAVTANVCLMTPRSMRLSADA